MPKEAKKTADKKTPAKRGTMLDLVDGEMLPGTDDLGAGIYGIGKAIESIAEKMPESWDIDRLINSIADLGYLKSVATSIDAYVIATYGTVEDRAKVVEHLKQRFGDGEVFRSR